MGLSRRWLETYFLIWFKLDSPLTHNMILWREALQIEPIKILLKAYDDTGGDNFKETKLAMGIHECPVLPEITRHRACSPTTRDITRST